MLLRIQLLFLLCTTFLAPLFSQELAYRKYSWDNDPKIHVLTAAEKEDNYLILKDKTILDFVYEQSGELVLYETRHTIIHFNNEKGIEEMNKVYIPAATVLDQTDIKARTIMSSGKVIPLTKSAIKKVDNLEDKGPFIIFAMEGVDKGGEIEYLYTLKRTYKTNSSVYLQTDKIKKDVSVDIYSPKNLIYEARGYNGFPAFTTDTIIKNKNHIYSSIDKIDALEDEEYSATNAARMRYEYQFAYNTSKSNARMYTWEYCGNNIYQNLFTYSKGEQKAVEKFLSKIGITNLTTDEAKIRALEQYMKVNTALKELENEIPIDKMLELKYGNSLSFHRFYVLAAKVLNIPIEVVATGNRMDRKFDPNFPSLNSIQEDLLYYPSIGKYLFSDNYMCRLGFPPPSLLGNKGLFIKETEIGDLKTGISKIKPIESVDYKKSYNNITASVEFDKETLTPVAKVKFELMGYSAYEVQPNMIFLDDAKKKEVGENIAKFMGVETVIKSSTLKGITNEDILVNPFVVESVVETPHLIEHAGNKYIFKVGEMLGTQLELYKQKERKTDVELVYTQNYTRLFDIKIPAGYKFKNLENINMDKRYTADGKDLASFISSYTVVGDVLKIKVYEDYRALFYPKENFEAYRSVVNASADFNKVVILLEKI